MGIGAGPVLRDIFWFVVYSFVLWFVSLLAGTWSWVFVPLIVVLSATEIFVFLWSKRLLPEEREITEDSLNYWWRVVQIVVVLLVTITILVNSGVTACVLAMMFLFFILNFRTDAVEGLMALRVW